MTRIVRSIVVFVLLLALPFNAVAGTIQHKNRVENLNVGGGVCWWACCDMVSREINANAKGIRDVVIENGYGAEAGAAPWHIYFWLWETNTRYKAIELDRNAEWLEENIALGHTPIVVVNMDDGWGGIVCHAIILVDIKVDDGIKYVQYVDPNYISMDFVVPFDDFYQGWIGTACVILPGKLFPDEPIMVMPND